MSEGGVTIAENVRLNRVETARALTASGFPISPTTLASKATRGGGPPYEVFGRTAMYRLGDVLEWASSRCVKRGER